MNPELFHHLADCTISEPHTHAGYTITAIAGGANNKLFRISNANTDYAVKFSIQDWRDRAGREHRALRFLEHALPDIAPRSLLLDCDTYQHALNVQTWLSGEAQLAPPTTATLWRAWATHYAIIHTITPEHAAAAEHILSDTTVMMRSATDALHRTIRRQLDLFPPEAQSPQLRYLLEQANNTRWPDWPPPRSVLCRGDANIRNFILSADGYFASVDWEYSGWGDGAYEIADVMAMPSNHEVPDADWNTFITAYCALRDHDRDAELRIRTYHALMCIWWVARFDRMLYQVPRGLDQRLVGHPADWKESAILRKGQRLVRAESALRSIGA